MARRSKEATNSTPKYDSSEPTLFTLRIIHGGKLGEELERIYLRGVNGPDLWPKCNLPPPLPPTYKKGKPGRPKKMRRRQPDEPPAAFKTAGKIKRTQKTTKCGKCGGSGHNSRSCARRKDTSTDAIPNEAEIGASRPFDATSTADSSVPNANSNTNVASSKQKLPVKWKSTKYCNVNISGGRSTRLSSVNVTPVIVKGGLNYIILPNLRRAIGSDSTRGVASVSGSTSAQAKPK